MSNKKDSAEHVIIQKQHRLGESYHKVYSEEKMYSNQSIEI